MQIYCHVYVFLHSTDPKYMLARELGWGSYLTDSSIFRHARDELECLEKMVVREKKCFLGISSFEPQIGISQNLSC